jgi:RNA polymerase primary sigma factor
MRSLEDILANPKKKKVGGFDHTSTNLLLRIPPDERSPELEALLVMRNERLAYTVAATLWKKFSPRLGAAIDFEDVLAAAMQGLLIGVRRFDSRYANEFSTYAVHWIRQVAVREIENNIGLARIPIHFQRRLRDVHSGKKDGQDRLACLVDFSLMHAYSLDAFVSEDTVLIQLVPSTCSLNHPILECDELPETQLFQQDLRLRIEDSLVKLMGNKNSEIVKMRFGFGRYGCSHTLEEVGKAFSITRERVRQIVQKYVEKAKKQQIFDEDELAVFRSAI